MSPPEDFDPAAVLAAEGERSHASRRLSDKILAAFSHACAVGETELAGRLKEVLTVNEAGRGGPGKSRQGYDPLFQAALWAAFIEARNRYKALVEQAGPDSAPAAAALEDMKNAYRRWDGA